MARNKSEIKFEKSSRVQVFVDDREARGECTLKLKELGAVVKPKRLVIGDFILSKRVCVERKTDSDFEASIIDGRLFAQAKDLKENFEAPLIALVGDSFERIHEKALRGAFIALAVDYRIPLFFFDDDAELADFLFALGEREQLRKPQEAKLRFEKRRFSLEQQQRFIVESLPMVGPKSARALLEHFGSVEKIFCASEDDLQEVDGVGEGRANEIKKVLTTKYKGLE